MSHHTKTLIIGAGPAGYTAAIYAARANLKPILFSGMQPGGQLTITTDVENFPGFAHAVQGPWLMEQMRDQALHVGTVIIAQQIESVDFSERPFLCKAADGQTYTADTVIIATGAQAKWLGIDKEETFRGFGVSACATCDGFFYKNKKVVVIGGGNSAVEEALYMTNHTDDVTLIHRRDSLRAEQIAQQRLFAHPSVKVIWNSVVTGLQGKEGLIKSLERIEIENVVTKERTMMDADGVFVAIGHTPMSGIFKGQLDLDEEGYILTRPGSTLTSVKGVFAAGDVQDKIFRQAVTAAGQGCMAALEAERYLSHGG